MSKKIGLDAAAEAEAKTEVEAVEKPREIKYTKAALVGSAKFAKRRDLLSVILDDGVTYTIAEVETAINNYLNKEV